MVSLDNGCVFPHIVKHELMHAVGFYHEQSRTDRDDHVVIHSNNIQRGKFIKESYDIPVICISFNFHRNELQFRKI